MKEVKIKYGILKEDLSVEIMYQIDGGTYRFMTTTMASVLVEGNYEGVISKHLGVGSERMRDVNLAFTKCDITLQGPPPADEEVTISLDGLSQTIKVPKDVVDELVGAYEESTKIDEEYKTSSGHRYAQSLKEDGGISLNFSVSNVLYEELEKTVYGVLAGFPVSDLSMDDKLRVRSAVKSFKKTLVNIIDDACVSIVGDEIHVLPMKAAYELSDRNKAAGADYKKAWSCN